MPLSLTSADWMLVTKLIYRINATVRPQNYAVEVLSLLQSALPFSWGLFTMVQREKNGSIRAAKVGCAGIEPAEAEHLTRAELDHSHFLLSLFMDASTKATRGPSRSELEHADELGRLFSRFPGDGDRALTVALQFQGEPLAYLMLFRGGELDAFSRREMCVLDELQDHIALRLHQLTEPAEPTGDGAGDYSVPAAWALRFEPWGISPREADVLYLFSCGLSDADICEKLFISRSTLKKHLNHIYQKGGISNRIGLLRFIEQA